MNSKTTDSAVKDEDVSDITQRQTDITIYIAWRSGKSLKDVVRETGLTIREINQRLKLLLKAEVKYEVENNGKENNT